MGADTQSLFVTQRARLVKQYADAKQPFDAGTFPYVSTRTVIFDVVAPYPSGAPTMAHAIARSGQTLGFFNYGQGDNISDGFGGSYNSTNADTNQETKNETNGGMDYVIEGVSLTARGHRIQWPTDDVASPALTDPDLINAYYGINATGASDVPASIGDPAGLMSPLQVDNPLNLQDLLAAKVIPLLSLTFVFDRARIFQIGTLDQIPEGGGKPPLFANGVARTDNRYRIPEGYLWRRAGMTDSNFNANAVLTQPLVIPIQLGGLFGVTTFPTQTGWPVPLKIALDLKMRVHGLSVQIPSKN